MQNAIAEMSKQKLFMSTLNFRTSLGRCTENACSHDHADNLKKVILQKRLTILTIIIS